MTGSGESTATAASRPSSREAQRDRILDVSRAILEGEGARALTIRRIAEAIDRTQPAIYGHFANKEALLEELVIEGFGELHESLAAASRSARTSSLAALSRAYVTFGTSRFRLYEAMFVGETTMAFAAGEKTPAAARAAFDLLRNACRTGRSRARSDVDDTRTEVYWASLHGLVMLSNKRRLRSGENYDSARLNMLVASIERGQETEQAT